MLGGIGGLFGLVSSVVGMGFQMAGQSEAQNAAKAQAHDSMMIALNRALGQQYQYNLSRVMQQRMATEAFRKAQTAQAAGFAAGVNQAGQGFSLSSAAGGARAQTRGELSTAVQGINENIDFSTNILGVNKQIDMLQMDIARQGSALADAQGKMQMGSNIASIGASFGKFLGGPNAAFPGLGSLFPSESSGGGGDIALGDQLNQSIFQAGTDQNLGWGW